MTEGRDATVASALDAAARLVAAASDSGDVDVERGEDGTVTWSAGGRPFAALSGDRAEFRLDGTIAAAALRTPDTGPSVRGPEWVAFAPRGLDRFALDRIESWFAAALRRAR